MKKQKENDQKYLVSIRKKILLSIIGILILQWIKKKPLCGQEIMNKIKKEFGFSFSSGTLYPILFNLRDRGIIASICIDKKRPYHLTPKGKALLNSMTADCLKLQKDLRSFIKK